MPDLKAVTARGFVSSCRHGSGQRAEVIVRPCVSCVQCVNLFPVTVCVILCHVNLTSRDYFGTLQGMMMGLQKQSANSLATLAKQQFDALQLLVQGTKTSSGAMTDTRDIGRPKTFKGEENKYGELKAKLLAYLRVPVPKSDEWIQWRGKKLTAILESDIDVAFNSVPFAVKVLAVKQYSTLLRCTGDDAFRVCHSLGSNEIVDEGIRNAKHEKDVKLSSTAFWQRSTRSLVANMYLTIYG